MTVLTSFVTVVYHSSQANIRLSFKYLCVVICVHADVHVREAFIIPFTYSFQAVLWHWLNMDLKDFCVASLSSILTSLFCVLSLFLVF